MGKFIMDLITRKRVLINLRDDILKFENEILEALNQDLNKCEFEGVATEVQYVLSELNHALKKLVSGLNQKGFRHLFFIGTCKSYIHYEPYGEVLVIGLGTTLFS